MFALPDPHLVKHIVVLLLGTVPLDPAFGASVYLCTSNPEPSWQYLGFISNEKPSAIFKVKMDSGPSAGENPFGMMAVSPSVRQVLFPCLTQFSATRRSVSALNLSRQSPRFPRWKHRQNPTICFYFRRLNCLFPCLLKLRKCWKISSRLPPPFQCLCSRFVGCEQGITFLGYGDTWRAVCSAFRAS